VDVLRKVLRSHDSSARIIAKIEDQLAVKNINDIIQTTDRDHGGAGRPGGSSARWRICRSSSGGS